ncbi:MAG: hypothetical protein AAFV53_01480 [Myxococcota bacterium]
MIRNGMAMLVLLIGCDSDGKDDTGSSTGSDELSAADEAIPDPDAGTALDPGCEDVEGQPVPGATSFFIGDFVITDGAVEGQEQWLLYANEAWVDVGGEDCRIIWNVTGTQEDSDSSCGACAYALALNMAVDTVASNCPTELYEGEEAFSVSYNVQVSGDTATFYYASGNTLGVGGSGDRRVTYTSDSTCKYF